MKLILFLIATSCFSQHILAQDWKKDTCALKGDVRSVVYTINYYFDDSKKKSEQEKRHYTYNKNGYESRFNLSSTLFGENINTYYRVYDPSGKRCLIEYYIQSGDTLGRLKFVYNDLLQVVSAPYYSRGRHWSTYNYRYDGKGQLTECFVVLQKDKDTIRHTYTYDENCHLIVESDLSKTTSKVTKRRYNDIGYLIEEEHYDTNWAMHSYIQLDKNNTIIRDSTVDHKNNPSTADSYIRRLSYDEKGQLVSVSNYDMAMQLNFTNTYTYLTEGEIATRIFYDAKKNEHSTYRYAYHFDARGNWTKKTTYVNDKRIEFEKRVIRYWPNSIQ